MPCTIRRAALLFLLILPSFLLSSCQDKVEIEIKVDESYIKLFEGKKIGIIGDSISSFVDHSPSGYGNYDGKPYVAFYPHGDVKDVDDTWWGIVASSLKIGVDAITNCSWSGSRVTGDPSSTKNASAACSLRRIKDLSCRGFNPDIIFCYVSCNDWASNVEVGSWQESDPLPSGNQVILSLREAYATMLSRLVQSYPTARIFCLTNLEDRRRDAVEGSPSENANGVSVEEWNSNIAQIAGVFGCEVIDLHSCGITYDNVERYTLDGIHPDKSGMKLMAKAVIDDLVCSFNY